MTHIQPKIKICGITRLEDALAATFAGADALGFNFSHTSARYIAPNNAAAIIKQLPPFVQTVGIFVEQSPSEINAIAQTCNLHYAQLHNDLYGVKEALAITTLPVIKVFRPNENFDVQEVKAFIGESHVTTYLFDAYRPDAHGGTGERIEATLAERIFQAMGNECYAILAGGLTPNNVAEAIRRIRPYGVDTASGVEKAPGIKDVAKMRAFVTAAQNA
uniref:N-(5'-phosphoribosyl)anthranilate isomerase n=1 Tax=Chlorobium chlorochromatii (strain CaD3) TaxID=340177 RepID=TRPF_CHLCH|nr:RecName: Full=N-(5'-phosphoribosyl)anthranilate isomerase; Short=PRAI [Chlorobium chlorochromatii CaD3]